MKFYFELYNTSQDQLFILYDNITVFVEAVLLVATLTVFIFFLKLVPQLNTSLIIYQSVLVVNVSKSMKSTPYVVPAL